MIDDGVGEFCSDSTCKQKDWMPVKCKYCKKIFCSEHSSIEGHKCPDFKQHNK